MRVTDGFTTSDFTSGDLNFTIDGITNPRSTASSSSFQVSVYDSSGYDQYEITSGVTVQVSEVSDFASISLDTASQVNGDTTNYKFSITLSNQLQASDIIRVTAPGTVTISSPV